MKIMKFIQKQVQRVRNGEDILASSLILLILLLLISSNANAYLYWKHQVQGDSTSSPVEACTSYLSLTTYSGHRTEYLSGIIGKPRYHHWDGSSWVFGGLSDGNGERQTCYATLISSGTEYSGGYVEILGNTTVCSTGYKDDGRGQCVAVTTLESAHKQARTPDCSKSNPKLGSSNPATGPNPTVGDPIIVATGNSFQTETDYQSQKPFGLSFVRFYNSSSNAIDNGVGKKWHHGFQRAVTIDVTLAQVARSTGQTFLFNFDSINNVWVGDVDIPDTLVELVDGGGVRTGWVYTDSHDMVETYNTTGQLVSLTNRAGQSKTFTYDVAAIDGGDDNADTLDKVTGVGGQVMMFAYDGSQRISTMTDPEGNEYTYSYDAAGNLASVTYPDNTPLDSLDNPVRSYHYENTTFPSHLTGLTDETGSRVTWSFDAEGRAISSELDGGVDKSTLDFSVADQVTVTNPLGKDTTYHFTTLHGVKKVTQVEGHATTSCAGANQNYTYDANGYLASKMDWQGNATNYVHDARGLETSRTEASGTVDERTITTQWHADFRLPIKITEPDKITDFVYDIQGRLTSQTTHITQP
jgi:YD repeat-containing protein